MKAPKTITELKKAFTDAMSFPLSLERYSAACPTLASYYYPRKIQTPTGYPNLKNNAAYAVHCDVATRFLSPPNDEQSNTLYATLAKGFDLWGSLKCPTFFLCNEFAKALSDSNIDLDFCPGSIEWPLQSMMLMLPEGACLPADSRGVINSILVTWWSASHERSEQPLGFEHLCNEERYPAKRRVPKRASVCVSCFDSATNAALPIVVDLNSPLRDAYYHSPPKSSAQEVVPELFRALLFAMKAVSAMRQMPRLVGEDKLIRPERVKKGRVCQSAIWSPIMVGENYRVGYQGGSAQSTEKRKHLRRGHFRQQRWGAARRRVKTIWIKPLWVNASLAAAA